MSKITDESGRHSSQSLRTYRERKKQAMKWEKKEVAVRQTNRLAGRQAGRRWDLGAVESKQELYVLACVHAKDQRIVRKLNGQL